MTRSIRNFLATHNLLAVSARQQEVAMNTEQDLDTTLAGGPEHGAQLPGAEKPQPGGAHRQRRGGPAP